MSTDIPADIVAKFNAKYNWLKRQIATLKGAVEPGIYPTPDGGWQCNYDGEWGYGCAITLLPGGDEPHEVHGEICKRWYQEGGVFEDGKRGWLGYPVSDEEIYVGDGDSKDRISHFENGDIVYTEKTHKTRIINIKDRAKWYESRRNELLALLNEASALNVPEKYADELRQTMRKCQEDAFEIALVGEFQGGKSTTFNALCDGRDISPRGLKGGGIKTSAAVISAQNIAGDEMKDGLTEWAEVSFKSPEEIALAISTILRGPLMDSQELRSLNGHLSDEEYEDAIVLDDSFPKLIDLHRPECVELLKKTAGDIWKRWETDKVNALNSDQLDQLRIATLQLRFFGAAERQQLMNRATLPIDQFQKLVAFPTDWETRWCNGEAAQFSFDEVAFVFVKSVLVRLHSENLGRLGCRITDCPGLFANAFDTCVAESAIRHADAAWYLINGEEQLGDKDRKAIRKIADWGLDGKIQATANIRTDWKYKSTKILDTTKSILVNMGMKFNVIPYNARLAFLAVQGELMLKHPDKLSELDKSNMAIDAKVKSVNVTNTSMWVRMVSRVGGFMDLEDIENITEMNNNSVKLARSSSRLDDIIFRLNNDIVPLKAESILVNRGSKRAAAALAAYEGMLLATEKTAADDEEKWNAEVTNAKQQLADFVGAARKIVDQLMSDDSLDHKARILGEDILNLTADDEYILNLSFRIARVYLECDQLRLLVNSDKMKEYLARELAPQFSDELKNAMSRGLEKWETGEGHRRLKESVEKVCGNIYGLWMERKIDAVELLKGFEPPSVQEESIDNLCGNLTVVMFKKAQLLDILRNAQNLWKYAVGEIGGLVIKFIGDIIARLGGRGNSLGMAVDALGMAVDAKREKLIGKLAHEIRHHVEGYVNDIRFRNGIVEPLEKQLRNELREIRGNLIEQLINLETDFADLRVKPNENKYSQSVEHRIQIAEQNRAIRIGVIEPLRKRIEAFANNVNAELAG